MTHLTTPHEPTLSQIVRQNSATVSQFLRVWLRPWRPRPRIERSEFVRMSDAFTWLIGN